GIGLRAMAQRDPLVEYQREGGDMFKVMMGAFMEEVVGFVFHLEVEIEQAPAASVGVVTGQDGRAVQIGAGANGTRHGVGTNGHDHGPLVESGPDPDDFGVAVHAVDGDEVPEEAEELVALESEPVGSVDSVSPDSPDDAPVARPQVKAKGLAPARGRTLTYSAPDEDGSVKTAGAPAGVDDVYAGVGRNAPCPCGSGKKFKMCHGRSGG
ncbi:SEC-C metal-binding domain-containing protein, partial [uncultured Friedmanniella sp.]|uniref:SEC-C metal-binding domain-containing protein n=1 Tax=uncultured Friedmanniella sp. TaxID=335381 RepID=UPI0035CBE90D